MSGRQMLQHSLECPMDLPLVFKYAAERSFHEPSGWDILRKQKMHQLQQLADSTEHIDKDIKTRMQESVWVAAVSLRLGFFTALTFLLR